MGIDFNVYSGEFLSHVTITEEENLTRIVSKNPKCNVFKTLTSIWEIEDISNESQAGEVSLQFFSFLKIFFLKKLMV